MFVSSTVSCQHYIVDISLDKVEKNGGLEFTGIPEGIPTLAEYLAEYCATTVRTTCSFQNFYFSYNSQIRTGV